MRRFCIYLVGTIRRLSLAMLLLLAGCEGCGGEQLPMQYSEKQGSLDCRVMIHLPGYDKSAPRPHVDLYWNGQKLFSGRLPAKNSSLDGMPTTLLEIQTNPGTHVLKVDSEGRSQQYEFQLNGGERRYLELFGLQDEGTQNEKRVLIKDIGSNLIFF